MRVISVILVAMLVSIGGLPESSLAVDEFDFEALFGDMDTTPAPAAQEEAEPEQDVPDAEPVAEPAPSEAPEVPAEETEILFDEPEAQPVPDPVMEEPEPEVAPVVDPGEDTVESDEELEQDARELAVQEEVRRRAAEVSGLKNLEAGFKALDEGQFTRARQAFEVALRDIPDRPATKDFRNRAQWGLAESHYRIARDIQATGGDLRVARQSLDRVQELSPNHRGLATLQRRVARDEARRLADQARPTPVEKRPDIVEKRETIDELMTEAVALYEAGELDRAELVFESVLVRDAYHTSAMRYLRRIAEDRMLASNELREATTARMIQAVRDAWNPPFRDDVFLPEDLRPDPTDLVTPARRLQEKMETLIIPRIEFRQANIRDVISFLRDASEATDPEGEGVNIILNLSMPDGAPAPTPTADADPWGDQDDWGAAAPRAEAGGVPSITLNLRRISLMEALRYITEVAGLRYRIEDSAVVITPAGIADAGRVITRLYPVQPSFLDVVGDAGGDAPQPGGFGEFQAFGARRPAEGRRGADVKAFFESAGVPFPVGTSITYNPTISQLIVANTPENLERFERILSQLNVVPNQVEIEARFVEVAEDDMQELGLQWIFTDNYQFLQRSGAGPFGGAERIQVDAGNVSSGMRFFGTTGSGVLPQSVGEVADPAYVGNILSVSSILTNPELRVVLHALSQNGNVDVLSAPRVTTRSGVNASIEVVTEIIYPTEFRVTEPTVTASAQGGGGLVTPPTVTPDNFETRRTGVILNVTPTVGPDGYTIDLALAPEVAELVDWIQYGSSLSIPLPAGGTQTFQYNIPQPVFASRNVTTSIVIWDGQTVVMGGLMRERLISYHDKIPLLGDIPVLGRLFRSEGTKSRKENLLIFVTARLVDPAGKPIHQAGAMGVPAPTD